MKRALKSPMLNAVCVSLFTAFYALLFIYTAAQGKMAGILHYMHREAPVANELFWARWSRFLADGKHAYLAYALIALTTLIVILLVFRRRAYDEYHVDKLLSCLAVAIALTMIAIALFFLLILSDPTGVVEKFSLFIVIHWVTVLLADLVFVLLYRWR